MALEYSDRQKELFRVYNTTDKNILVNSGPGSGKSFTMLQLAKQTPAYKKSIFLAFNKSIADENAGKLPNHISSSTLHSLGFRCLFKLIPGAKFVVNEIKTFTILRKRLKLTDPGKFRNEKVKNKYFFDLADLYNFYRINLVVFNQPKEAFLKEIEDLATVYDFELKPTTLEDFYNVVEIMEEEDYSLLKGKSNIIDYTDMLYLLKYFPEASFPKYDVVFLDECQDVNPLQKALFDKIRKPRGRFVSVGDRRQLIYAFQGSNMNSFDQLAATPNTIELPLDISYRCSQSVIQASNLIFPDLPMRAFESNPEGIVRTGEIGEVEKGDFVLCRNNKPLIELFIELLKQKKSAYIYGKDYGEKLLKLLEEVANLTDAEVLDHFDQKLIRTREMLLNKGITNPSTHPQYGELVEKIIIINLLYTEFLSYREVGILIGNLFSDKVDKDSSITLMTIHRSKGLEAERVFFLLPSLIPSPYAASSNSLYSEKCLYYVAITRAKSELIYLKDPGLGALETGKEI